MLSWINRLNKDIINNADIMVINSGYSAISEAVVLCKPIIVIPDDKTTG